MMRTLSCYRYRIANRLHLLRRALAYATGQLSADDAQDIILDCRDAAGWYPLMILTCQNVMDDAIDEYGDPARALENYLPAACAQVARKWECYGDEYANACSWALDTAKEYAAQDGLHLVSETKIFFNSVTSAPDGTAYSEPLEEVTS